MLIDIDNRLNHMTIVSPPVSDPNPNFGPDATEIVQFQSKSTKYIHGNYCQQTEVPHLYPTYTFDKMLQGKALLYTVTMLTALGFMLIGYDNVSFKPVRRLQS